MRLFLSGASEDSLLCGVVSSRDAQFTLKCGSLGLSGAFSESRAHILNRDLILRSLGSIVKVSIPHCQKSMSERSSEDVESQPIRGKRVSGLYVRVLEYGLMKDRTLACHALILTSRHRRSTPVVRRLGNQRHRGREPNCLPI